MANADQKTILIIEDSTTQFLHLQTLLEENGLQVAWAETGLKGVDMAQELQPDLIMLDVRMPKMTGYEACRELKDNPETSHIPVVILSAKGQEGEIQEGIESGADHYFVKPFAPEDLTKQVKEILRNLGVID